MTDFEQLRNDPELPRSCREAQLGGVVGRGWWPLIRELEAKLDQKFPDWAPVQVKEKFGSLCFFANPNGPDRVSEVEIGEGKKMPILSSPERDESIDYEAFNGLIAETERASSSTCEECGEAGKLHVSERGWYRTLCSSCAKEQGFNEPPRRDQRMLKAAEYMSPRSAEFVKSSLASWNQLPPEQRKVPTKL